MEIRHFVSIWGENRAFVKVSPNKDVLCKTAALDSAKTYLMRWLLVWRFQVAWTEFKVWPKNVTEAENADNLLLIIPSFLDSHISDLGDNQVLHGSTSCVTDSLRFQSNTTFPLQTFWPSSRSPCQKRRSKPSTCPPNHSRNPHSPPPFMAMQWSLIGTTAESRRRPSRYLCMRLSAKSIHLHHVTSEMPLRCL